MDVRDQWGLNRNDLAGYVPTDVGLVGIDIDAGEAEAGKAWSRSSVNRWRKSGTRDDELHLLYRYDGEPLGNLNSEIPGVGSGEIRYDKGYLVAWHPVQVIEANEGREDAVSISIDDIQRILKVKTNGSNGAATERRIDPDYLRSVPHLKVETGELLNHEKPKLPDLTFRKDSTLK